MHLKYLNFFPVFTSAASTSSTARYMCGVLASVRVCCCIYVKNRMMWNWTPIWKLYFSCFSERIADWGKLERESSVKRIDPLYLKKKKRKRIRKRANDRNRRKAKVKANDDDDKQMAWPKNILHIFNHLRFEFEWKIWVSKSMKMNAERYNENHTKYIHTIHISKYTPYGYGY